MCVRAMASAGLARSCTRPASGRTLPRHVRAGPVQKHAPWQRIWTGSGVGGRGGRRCSSLYPIKIDFSGFESQILDHDG